MGLLDDLLGGLAGGGLGQGMGQARGPSMQSGAGAGNLLALLLPVVLSVLANRGGPASGGGLGEQAPGGLNGGLGGLLEQLQRAGFGEQARSWVGTGQNLPISPDVIGQIFGPQGLSAIARQAGLSEHETSQGLSQLLPEVVDHLTPGGQVPDLGALSSSVDDLVRKMGMRPE